jgi:phospholipid-binding lipoprotein MlaA
LRRFVIGMGHGRTATLVCVFLALALTGCGSLSGSLHADSALLAGSPAGPGEERDAGVAEVAPPPSPAAPASASEEPSAIEGASAEESVDLTAIVAESRPAAETSSDWVVAMAQAGASQTKPNAEDAIEEEYDPLEPFNEKMFEFNRQLDRYVLKPIAKAYDAVMPERFEIMIANGFDNLMSFPRSINSLLQGKWEGFGREVARFLVNSTVGVGGLFDPARDYLKLEKSREDFGQTLGVWGTKPGPYLILPLMEPLTVRDGVGKLVDSFMHPLSYVLPFFWDRLGMTIGDTINERALNLDLFQGFEETVVDMYSAVRNAYLRRREQLIRE